jgi:hypothetical protein
LKALPELISDFGFFLRELLLEYYHFVPASPLLLDYIFSSSELSTSIYHLTEDSYEKCMIKNKWLEL